MKTFWFAAALAAALSTVAIAATPAPASSTRINSGNVGNGSAYELWRTNRDSSFQLKVWRSISPSSSSPTCTYNFASNRDALAFWREISRLQGCPGPAGQSQAAQTITVTTAAGSQRSNRFSFDIDQINTVPGDAPTTGTAMAALTNAEQEILALVNAERQRAGVQPLQISSRLSAAAQRHANDLAATRRLSHTGSDGSSVADRAIASGYRSRYVGENAYMGPQTATAAMGGWMNSPGHRQNILRSNYTDIGVGVAQGPGGPYWVQVFGQP